MPKKVKPLPSLEGEMTGLPVLEGREVTEDEPMVDLEPEPELEEVKSTSQSEPIPEETVPVEIPRELTGDEVMRPGYSSSDTEDFHKRIAFEKQIRNERRSREKKALNFDGVPTKDL